MKRATEATYSRLSRIEMALLASANLRVFFWTPIMIVDQESDEVVKW